MENFWLYSAYETCASYKNYLSMCAKYCNEYIKSSYHRQCDNNTEEDAYNNLLTLEAIYTAIERINAYYPRPEFNINYVKIGDKVCEVQEQPVMRKNFCSLLHFSKTPELKQEKMLIIAPMAGHNSSLIRRTISRMLVDYEVYVTDWMNAKHVSLTKGNFDLDDYMDYLVEFLEYIGPKTNVLAICQPSVPAFAVTAVMAEDNHECTPKNLIMIGGPIDTRDSPTEVNVFATKNPLIWFAQNMITRVPMQYTGRMRRVYPGFMNLTGFMSMNLSKHANEHFKLLQNILLNKEEEIEKHKSFYNEYLAVSDMTAEFYLQTIDTVFQKHSLPRGIMKFRNRLVNAEAITATGIMAIEGGQDNITGRGQTLAALDMCKNLNVSKKHYLLQENVGHYGSFSGSKFDQQIAPEIIKFITKNK